MHGGRGSTVSTPWRKWPLAGAGAWRGLVGLVGLAHVPGGAPDDLHAGRTGELASARMADSRRAAGDAASVGSRSRSPDGEEARMRREHWQARWVGALAA